MIAPADTLATHAGMPFNAADALDTAGTLFSSLPPAPKLVEGMPRDIGTFWSVEALL